MKRGSHRLGLRNLPLCIREWSVDSCVSRIKLDRREHPEHEGLSINGSSNHRPLTIKDLFIKDAFLVFRAMCKLTMKPLNTERHVHRFRNFHCFTP